MMDLGFKPITVIRAQVSLGPKALGAAVAKGNDSRHL